MAHRDRRVFPRLPAKIRVRFRRLLVDSRVWRGVWGMGNISRKGVFLPASEVLADGDVVELVFDVAGEAKGVRVLGKVAWSQGEGENSGMGIEFASLQSDLLEKVVRASGRGVWLQSGVDGVGEPEETHGPAEGALMPVAEERRQYPRIQTALRVRFRSVGLEMEEPEEGDDMVALGEGGAFVPTRQPMEPGRLVELEFGRDLSQPVATVLARVVWWRKFGDRPGMGVEFVHLMPGLAEGAFRVARRGSWEEVAMAAGA